MQTMLPSAAIMAPLLLQQPANKSNYRENSEHLAPHGSLGSKIKDLHEGQTIQVRKEGKEK